MDRTRDLFRVTEPVGGRGKIGTLTILVPCPVCECAGSQVWGQQVVSEGQDQGDRGGGGGSKPRHSGPQVEKLEAKGG